jgi:hypothetical protein
MRKLAELKRGVAIQVVELSVCESLTNPAINEQPKRKRVWPETQGLMTVFL